MPLSPRQTPPSFADPYPDPGWRTISDFVYTDPLVLYRAPEALRMRDGEDADYLVAQDYRVAFRLDGADREIVVPKGMATDLASVPKALRSVVGRVGPHLEASIVHDFLYIAWQDLPGHGARDADRHFADDLFWYAMIAANMSRLEVDVIYHAVRALGGLVYDERDEPRYFDLP